MKLNFGLISTKFRIVIQKKTDLWKNQVFKPFEENIRIGFYNYKYSKDDAFSFYSRFKKKEQQVAAKESLYLKQIELFYYDFYHIKLKFCLICNMQIYESYKLNIQKLDHIPMENKPIVCYSCYHKLVVKKCPCIRIIGKIIYQQSSFLNFYYHRGKILN
jgi:hypothetical protein